MQESLGFLDKVKTTDGKVLSCILVWKINIITVLGLWQYLKTEENFQFILQVGSIKIVLKTYSALYRAKVVSEISQMPNSLKNHLSMF